MTYYDVFGVKPTASTKAIKDAHRALAKKYHPDINDSEDAHEKMAKLNEANEVLSDATKREEYHKSLSQNRRQQERTPEATETEKAEQLRKKAEAEQRAAKAEQLRKKAEEEQKTAKVVHEHRKSEEQRKAESSRIKKEAELFNKKTEVDRQHVISVLLSLVRGGDGRLNEKTVGEADSERQQEIEVLLSLVRREDDRLRQAAEEAERQKRIETLLSLLKNGEEEAMI